MNNLKHLAKMLIFGVEAGVSLGLAIICSMASVSEYASMFPDKKKDGQKEDEKLYVLTEKGRSDLAKLAIMHGLSKPEEDEEDISNEPSIAAVEKEDQ